jgi:MscS family membrane protein
MKSLILQKQTNQYMRHLISCCLFLFFFFSASSQNVQGPEITLQSPYNTIDVHLHYLQTDSYAPALSARTFYNVSDSTEAKSLAIQLKQILDGKGLYVQMNKISQNANFTEDTISDRNVYTLFPDELPSVYVEKIDGRWYYSAETIENIPRLHNEVYPYGVDILLRLLPRVGHNKILGLALWQYLGLLILIVIGLLLHEIFSRIFSPIVKRLSSSKLYPSLVDPSLIRKIARLFSVFLIIRLIRILLPPLQLPIQAATFAFAVIKIVTTILVILIVLRIIEVIMLYANKYTKTTDSKLDEQLMPIIQRSLQGIVVIGGIIQALRIFEVDVTALIAGLSIGGLALALAAQDTVKNLFGSLTIFLDRPFQIGDWINFSGIDGTVEEVGFRSTRVRTFEGSLVYVPNGKLADMIVNNYGLRVYRRFRTTLNITYNTPTQKITPFIDGLKEIIYQHPATLNDRSQVALSGLNASSIDIIFHTFLDVPGWPEELQAKQETLIAILDLAQLLGVSFAFPSTSIYVENMPTEGDVKPKDQIDNLEESMKKFLSDYQKKVNPKE